ncbi:hypothetical protein EWM64_g325 [Hericium alpestre]|uniref:C2H2-type domain-containing protein n=1 Tax=Hericium alpestre TaxID=135208 RepID=A0A4Z0ABM4_9AGAM|nr:hypothetical protein EWM64_g325 [Hericium alpestre]
MTSSLDSLDLRVPASVTTQDIYDAVINFSDDAELLDMLATLPLQGDQVSTYGFLYRIVLSTVVTAFASDAYNMAMGHVHSDFNANDTTTFQMDPCFTTAMTRTVICDNDSGSTYGVPGFDDSQDAWSSTLGEMNTIPSHFSDFEQYNALPEVSIASMGTTHAQIPTSAAHPDSHRTSPRSACQRSYSEHTYDHQYTQQVAHTVYQHTIDPRLLLNGVNVPSQPTTPPLPIWSSHSPAMRSLGDTSSSAISFSPTTPKLPIYPLDIGMNIAGSAYIGCKKPVVVTAVQTPFSALSRHRSSRAAAEPSAWVPGKRKADEDGIEDHHHLSHGSAAQSSIQTHPRSAKRQRISSAQARAEITVSPNVGTSTQTAIPALKKTQVDSRGSGRGEQVPKTFNSEDLSGSITGPSTVTPKQISPGKKQGTRRKAKGEKEMCPWDGCGKHASRLADLRRHIRNIHLQQKARCRICGEGAREVRKDSVQRHLRTTHHFSETTQMEAQIVKVEVEVEPRVLEWLRAVGIEL